jgi:hypothetical protein
MEFEPFPKLPRISRKCIITEKIDGTNASVCIEDVGLSDVMRAFPQSIGVSGTLAVYAGSRTRWLKPEGTGPKGCDNFGFAAWVRDNIEELVKLGPGRHFGEWWGQGIQRSYGMKAKYFSLFNADRWQSARPACCDIVPVLYRGEFNTEAVTAALNDLRVNGSRAAPGFMKPEGVVVYHKASNSMFKKTIEKDEEPKGKERDKDGNAR